MQFDDCHALGHLKDSPDEWCCGRCEADQCPDCEAWFVDYDAFLEHTDHHG